MQSINFASAFFSNASPPVRVLTLDGSPSAISAVVQIKILRELMKAIWKKNPPPDARHSRPLERDINEMRPAEYFVCVSLAHRTVFFLTHPVLTGSNCRKWHWRGACRLSWVVQVHHERM